MSPLLLSVFALLAAPAADPVVLEADGPVLSALDQWRAIEACPRVANEGGGGFGSAVVIGQKDQFVYLLTAKHVLDSAPSREYQFTTWARSPAVAATFDSATTVASSRYADFAVVKTSLLQLKHIDPPRSPLDPKTPPLPAEFRRPVPLPRLQLAGPDERPKSFPFDALSVGWSRGESPSCQKVTVRAKRLVRHKEFDPLNPVVAFYWEADTPPERGRSGGPLLNRDGKVIGVCAAQKDDKVGYYTHLDEILAELKHNKLSWLWEDAPK